MEVVKNHTVKFGNKEINIYCCNGLKYIDIKKVCDNIGINWPGQLKKIKESPKYLRGWKEVGNNKVLCLDKKTFFLWLWGIEPDRVKQNIQKVLVDYQENLDKIIDNFLETLYKKEVEKEFSNKKENLKTLQNKVSVSKEKIELIQQLNSLSPFSNEELFNIRNKILGSVVPGVETKLQPVTQQKNFTSSPHNTPRQQVLSKQESNISYL